jgi:uncharacterized protein GlcG (DUF336 family)
MTMLDSAQAATTRALATARTRGTDVAVVVVDPAGRTVTTARMDAATTVDTRVATKKAFSAAAFRRSTTASAAALQPPDRLVNVLLSDERLCFLPGGELLDGGCGLGVAGAAATDADLLAIASAAVGAAS